jgi:two-component system, sensor histidine kinase and response regulator
MLQETTEILIVEDSPTEAQELQEILERHGYRVTAAADCQEALNMARQHKPDLILSDIMMPQMDGYELCRAIRADAFLTDVPVILVTALSDPEDVIRGMECRADNFIIKPYDENQLLARVQLALENRGRQSGGNRLEVFFNGRKHVIAADGLQMLNLLLSTCEPAIQRNKEMTLAQVTLQRRNSSLEVANQELEAFSSSVAHELRLPLGNVYGWSSLLLDRFAGQMPQEAERMLQNVRAGARRMQHLIEDLLRLSRVSRQELFKQTVDLQALVQEVVGDLREKQGERQVEVQIGALPKCVGDHPLLKQALANLLSNAFKFTSKTEHARVEAGCARRGSEIVYFVKDNGAGFDMKHASKLFGVFQRLHKAGQFDGTGVGLSIAHRIIQRHGGRIWAEAEVGKGAAFYFTLPQCVAQASSASQN